MPAARRTPFMSAVRILVPSPGQTPPLTTSSRFMRTAHSWAARGTRLWKSAHIFIVPTSAPPGRLRHEPPRRGHMRQAFCPPPSRRPRTALPRPSSHEHQYRNRRVESHHLDPCGLPVPDRPPRRPLPRPAVSGTPRATQSWAGRLGHVRPRGRPMAGKTSNMSCWISRGCLCQAGTRSWPSSVRAITGCCRERVELGRCSRACAAAGAQPSSTPTIGWRSMGAEKPTALRRELRDSRVGFHCSSAASKTSLVAILPMGTLRARRPLTRLVGSLTPVSSTEPVPSPLWTGCRSFRVRAREPTSRAVVAAVEHVVWLGTPYCVRSQDLQHYYLNDFQSERYWLAETGTPEIFELKFSYIQGVGPRKLCCGGIFEPIALIDTICFRWTMRKAVHMDSGVKHIEEGTCGLAKCHTASGVVDTIISAPMAILSADYRSIGRRIYVSLPLNVPHRHYTGPSVVCFCCSELGPDLFMIMSNPNSRQPRRETSPILAERKDYFIAVLEESRQSQGCEGELRTLYRLRSATEISPAGSATTIALSGASAGNASAVEMSYVCRSASAHMYTFMT
ncbi:hypothetical protein GGX14DRAFT_385671 [Mycena pura]|uniref:Uncharacterized protein n=1 Tax=Mycena pura TaxID=153505 RepID=A0AAD6YR11_9AGAR|nr:hypothetical protein GGX14DRAFT_385671 [Mycena pura]